MKTIQLEVEGALQEFKMFKNTLKVRMLVMEFDKENDRQQIKYQKEILAVAEGNSEQMAEIVRDSEIHWIKRGIEKCKMLIDREGMSESDKFFIDSEPDDDFWSVQDLDAIKEFNLSF